MLPRSLSQSERLERMTTELRTNYLCFESLSVGYKENLPCEVSLVESRAYLANYGDWQISRSSYADDGLFRETIEDLGRCINEESALQNVSDISQCQNLSPFMFTMT